MILLYVIISGNVVPGLLLQCPLLGASVIAKPSVRAELVRSPLINKRDYFITSLIYPSLNCQSWQWRPKEGCEMVICAHKSVIVLWCEIFQCVTGAWNRHCRTSGRTAWRQASWPCMQVFTLPVAHRIYSVFSVLCCSTMYRSFLWNTLWSVVLVAYVCYNVLLQQWMSWGGIHFLRANLGFVPGFHTPDGPVT